MAILVFLIVIIIHEFGHFIIARKNGVKVNEFGIGFPPRAIGWVKKDGKWTKLPKSEYDKPQKSLILRAFFPKRGQMSTEFSTSCGKVC